MSVLAKTEEELNALYYRNLFDAEVMEIQQYYPYDDMDKIWRFKSTFNSSSEIIQAAQHTDCAFRCGSIAQTDIITTNVMTKNSVNVYFYQFGPLEEPWDSVTHGHDVGCLFDVDVRYSPFPDYRDEKFAIPPESVKLTMKWIGEYVKGIGPLNENGEPATIQNNNYLRIVGSGDVKVVDLKELDIVKERCKLWESWGDAAYLNMAICWGMEQIEEQEVSAFTELFSKEINDTQTAQ